MEVIGLVAAIFSIIGGVYLFIKWISDRQWNTQPSGVFTKEYNLYLTYPSATPKQITFVSSDSSPVLGKSKVIFFRSEIKQDGLSTTGYRLMAINTNTLKESVISDQKPYSDGLNNSFKILQPSHLCLSADQTKAIFIIEKYATASQLVQIEIATGKWTELFSVEHFEILNSSKYNNKILVAVSEIRDRGRDVYYKVCDLDGNTLHEFDDYEEYMKFRSKEILREK